MICGFVFTTNQVSSEDYLVTGAMVRAKFSHGFGVFNVFVVYPSAQWFPRLYYTK